MIRALFLPLLFPIYSFGQLNCNYFLIDSQDSSCYKACLLATEAANLQGLGESQRKFDEAIKLCPKLDYAYSEKAVPYLKRGDFITWKRLIDKAVELDPKSRLGYRGWCRYQFLSDYQGAIDDFERLEELIGAEIGFSINGDYHLAIAKALCYKALGKRDVAIQIIEQQISKKMYSPMPYDYLHLGVLKLETGDFNGAIRNLEKEIAINNYLADTYFYLALSYKQLGAKDKCIDNLKNAKEFYLKGYKRSDPYTDPIDKIMMIWKSFKCITTNYEGLPITMR